MNSRLRETQHEKLRALIQPLGDALAIEPADPEEDDEAEIWEGANDLYNSLTDFVNEGDEPGEGAEKAEQGPLPSLLAELAEGRCPGIKGATAFKIQQYAAKRGYV